MMSKGKSQMAAERRGRKRSRAMPTGVARKIIKMRILIAALTIAAMSALWSIAAPTAGAAEPQKFGDWLLRCEARSEGQGELCYLSQTVNYSKGDVSGKLLDIKIGALGKGKDLYAIIMLPLGLNIQAGALMQSDDGEPTPLTIQTCTNLGCRSVAPISDDLLWGFRQGKVLKVGFIPFGSKQTIVVEASLTGFTAAYKSLAAR